MARYRRNLLTVGWVTEVLCSRPESMSRRDRIPADADGARASVIVTHRPAGLLILSLAGDRQWGNPNLGEQERKAGAIWEVGHSDQGVLRARRILRSDTLLPTPGDR